MRASVLIFLILTTATYADDPRVVLKNNAAVKNLVGEAVNASADPQAKDTAASSPQVTRDAYRDLIQALSLDPLNPKLRQNLGLVYLVNRDEGKALAEFKLAAQLSNQNPQLKFESLFNAAVVSGAMSDIDGALAFYQAALELNPESLEVKKNIELLLNNQGQGKGKDQQEQAGDQGEQQQDQSQNQDNKGEGGQGEKQEQKGPKPFESKELTKEDVRRILEELKNQEQKIRAELLSKGAKEKPNGKDW
jgi:Ca-activated chloride channel family protein